MILRAIFCIAAVSVLMPHEPDLGFGRPGAQGSVVQSAASWMSGTLQAPNSLCKDHTAVCVATLGALDSVQSVAVRSLAQVKADIEDQERARSLRTRLAAN
ncbi:MAG: hypothetical protein ABSA49_18775 [Rhizomicrobium sp.]|jgi:hypothetical protein